MPLNRMEFSYGAELRKRETVSYFESGMDGGSDDTLVQFLLECAPMLARYAQAKEQIHGGRDDIPHPHHERVTPNPKVTQALQTCHQIHQEFIMRYVRSTPTSCTAPPITIPTTCEGCLTTSTMVDDMDGATYTCTTCGQQKSYGIAADGGYAFDDQKKGSVPYMYDPNVYFGKCLDEAQSVHKGILPWTLLRDLRDDFQKRNIQYHAVKPDVVRAALKRLGKPRYYHCRWAITKQINPTYVPLELSGHIVQKLKALFRGMLVRFPRIVAMLGMRRKNLPSYPFFTQQGLLFLKCPVEARAFRALKSHKRHQLQSMLLQMIFLDFDHKIMAIPLSSPIRIRVRHTTHSMGPARPRFGTSKPPSNRHHHSRQKQKQKQAQRRKTAIQKIQDYPFSAQEKRVLRFWKRRQGRQRRNVCLTSGVEEI